LQLGSATIDIQSIISSVIPNHQDGLPQIPFLSELFGMKGESSGISAHWWYGFYPVAYLTAFIICISLLIWISIRTVMFYQVHYAATDSLFRDNKSAISIKKELAEALGRVLEGKPYHNLQKYLNRLQANQFKY